MIKILKKILLKKLKNKNIITLNSTLRGRFREVQNRYQTNHMEHISMLTKRRGCDAGFNDSVLHPLTNNEGRKGKSGFDKDLSLADMVRISYFNFGINEQRPNIIIKSGTKAKWYLKYFPKEQIEQEIRRQQEWRADNVARCTMWIIDWDM